jgi:putative Holliday junction resolvase
VSGRRLIAVDYGLKRIGLAATDALGLTVQPLPVLENDGAESVQKRLLGIVAEYDAAVVIVGIPLNMDGTDSTMTTKVRVFVANLKAALPDSVELVGRDERLTSWAAEQEGFAKGQKPWKDKGKIDTRSAMILLEEYLAETRPDYFSIPEDAPVIDPPHKKQRRGRRERRQKRG